jgi:hypothetical protein
MTVNTDVAHNPWAFDNFQRHAMQALFDERVNPDHLERNRNYREGLLQILDGLAKENPFDVSDGVMQIARQFGGLVEPPPRVHQDDARDIPALPDAGQPRAIGIGTSPFAGVGGVDHEDEVL